MSSPRNGDVLITSRDGRHYVSVVPAQAHISLKSLSHARDLAERWMEGRPGVSLWLQEEYATQLLAAADEPQDPEAA